MWNIIKIIIKYLFSIVIYLIHVLFIPVMAKQPILQSSVLRGPSEIILIYWFGAQETFIIIIINGENSNVFMEIMKRFLLFSPESSKEQYLFEIFIFVTL